MSFYDINKSLEKRLSSMPGLPDIAWPNVDYKPILGTSYLRVNNLPAASRKYNIYGAVKNDGIFQITVNSSIGSGAKYVLEMVDVIRNHFEDQTLLENGQKTYVGNISLTPPSRDRSWYTLGVQIEYESITN